MLTAAVLLLGVLALVVLSLDSGNQPPPDGRAAAALPPPGGTAAPTPSPDVDPDSPVDPDGPDGPVGPLTRSVPTRLRIPSLDVDTDLVPLGLRADGALEVPAAGFPAGWFTGAPTPGELGPAVLAGHVDLAGSRGVFYDLRRLSTGDEITVSREDGRTLAFRVTRVEQFAKDAFPTELVYGDLDHAGLRLITCGGSFDRKARSYVDNLVVFAELADPLPV